MHVCLARFGANGPLDQLGFQLHTNRSAAHRVNVGLPCYISTGWNGWGLKSLSVVSRFASLACRAVRVA